ncbi:DUF1566 domain-containing protein, partial [Desulfobacterales bacterium HSG17]|nr:DUF1566 domain-containing protein [Desulfobacterales bacterium HSG17]
NIKSKGYWSSNTMAPFGSEAYFAHNIEMGGSYASTCGKGARLNVIAVRGGRSSLFDNFIINNDGTVTDTATGLMWQQEGPDKKMIWKDALTYCENLYLADNNDWRLPSLKELGSITDLNKLNPAVDSGFFPETQTSTSYWSSTENYTMAWGIYFGSGGIDDHQAGKTYFRYVRAVRGGQSQLPGKLFITSPQQASIWNVNSTMPITWETAGISGDVIISTSYDGGDTFETIAASTSNDGYHEWKIPAKTSFNSMLKIEPVLEPAKSTTQGLFTIENYIKTFPSELILTEPSEPDQGISKTFTIMLTKKLTDDVIMNLFSSNPGEFKVEPETIIFNTANQSIGIKVSITPEYDGASDGDQTGSIIAGISDTGGETFFQGISVMNVLVRNIDKILTLDSI